MKNRTHAVMLPTNTPDQGRWIRYGWRNLYPGPSLICDTDELAQREARGRLSAGHLHTAELKRRIRRRLGVKALA